MALSTHYPLPPLKAHPSQAYLIYKVFFHYVMPMIPPGVKNWNVTADVVESKDSTARIFLDFLISWFVWVDGTFSLDTIVNLQKDWKL